jgi:hypothetical protein
MIYPADIWQTKSEHCCWLCDRCHELLHRAPAKYIAMATTEQITRMVIEAQKNEEDGFGGDGVVGEILSVSKKAGAMNEDICAFCGHSQKEHCKGNVAHGDLKEIGKMLTHPKETVCTGRHCNQPLCCCVDFQ